MGIVLILRIFMKIFQHGTIPLVCYKSEYGSKKNY